MNSPASFREEEYAFMRRALELARRGDGMVSPNPPVGCVLVRDGGIVGEGWHAVYGGPHAEAAALSEAGGRARGATAYVTLGPCGHHGKQPPCAEALLRAGVAEVVAAVADPTPGAGAGLGILERGGVAVREGLLRGEAVYAARGFFKYSRVGLPFATLKYAMTLDGRIASPSGDSRWISSPESRELVHELRSRADAVMVGIGTALADDPLLTARGGLPGRSGDGCRPQPRRVVVDSRCRLDPKAKMLREPGGRVLVAAAAAAAEPGAVAALRAAGAEVMLLPGTGGGVDLAVLMARLAETGVRTVLCEGGAELAASLLEHALLDEVVAFVGPKFVGGAKSPGPVGGEGRGRMADAIPLRIVECRRVGCDVMIRADFGNP